MKPASRIGTTVLPAVLALLLAVLGWRAATSPVDDGDVWWLAAAGRHALAHGDVPRTNGWSYTDPDEPWVLHETGFALLYGAGLERLGPAFFPFLGLAAGMLVAGVSLASMLAAARHPASAFLVLALVVAAERAALFAPRPSHVALVFPVVLLALALPAGMSRARATAAVFVEWLWACSHGSFPLGVALLGAAALDGPPGERRARLGLAAVAAAATVANPQGLRAHGLVDRYLRGGDATAAAIHQHVVEFFPIWRGSAPFVDELKLAVAAAFLLVAGAALAAGRHRVRALFSLALFALAAYQVRHLPLAILLAGILLHPEVDDRFDAAPAPARARRAAAWWAAAVVVPGLVAAAALWGRALAARPPDRWIADGAGGPELAAIVRALPNGANVYLPFEKAGLAIWLGAPRDIRVFFDPRNDCYRPRTAEAAFALEAGSREAAGVLTERGTDLAVLPLDHPLLPVVELDPDWSFAAGSPGWRVFASRVSRKPSPDADLTRSEPVG